MGHMGYMSHRCSAQYARYKKKGGEECAYGEELFSGFSGPGFTDELRSPARPYGWDAAERPGPHSIRRGAARAIWEAASISIEASDDEGPERRDTRGGEEIP